MFFKGEKGGEKLFKAVNQKQSFVEMEEKIMDFWVKEKCFQESLENRKGNEKVIFFDGPPFANGLPHYGHILISTLKDVMARYWTMKGFYVPRVFGWDCHGLPVEYEIEKSLGLNGKKEIEEMGVENFNMKCRESVFKYVNEWEGLVGRLGRWVDFENGYATLENKYMESIWYVFKQIWDKGLVYQGHKAMQICTRCETPLSNFEVSLGYKEVTDLSVTVCFELVDEPGTYFLAWTTTPWSLVSVTGLAIGVSIEYVKVKSGGKSYILAKNRVEDVFKNSGKEIEEVIDLKLEDVLGKKYVHVFDYYNDRDEVKNSNAVFSTVGADYVMDSDGTGIVTINGAFGEDDLNSALKYGLPVFVNVKTDGTYTDEVLDFAGKYVKGQDLKIAAFLEKKDLLFKKENYRHSYPHCWRCDSPLLNYATKSWFIKITEIKEKLLKNNQKINWQPDHIRDGRFGKWLEGARDWAISRNRFWGCPMPIWENENGDRICVSSIEELEKLSGGKLPKRGEQLDLHLPYIDEITFMHPDYVDSGDEKYLMKRVSEVFDCWFESGSMPYAQLHYPFENKEELEKNFPANFIVEAIDQTRGWFYTLHILATILFDEPAFRNVVVTGHVVAADGEKMSKRKKNYPDPVELIGKKGVDAIRFYLASSNVTLGEQVRFSEGHVDETLKKINLTLWNTYSFFVTYANIDGFNDRSELKKEDLNHPLDKWIVSELNLLIKNVDEGMNKFQLMKAAKPIVNFIDGLSNWYIRRSRRRFWKSENDVDKKSAYKTLYYVLVNLVKVLAPFMPFLTEEIYKNLTGEKSVHLVDWPKFRAEFLDEGLVKEVGLVREIVGLGHGVRDFNKIKVRQPLSKIEVAVRNEVEKAVLVGQVEVIKEELNVKEVEFIEDFGDRVQVVLKVNAKMVGPRLGARVQEVIRLGKEGKFVEVGGRKVEIGGVVLDEGEYEKGFVGKESGNVASFNGLTIVLNVELNEELVNEGIARELVRFVQDMRKEVGYEVSERIVLFVNGSKKIDDVVTKFADYICRETLALELIQSGEIEWDAEKEVEIGGEKAKIAIRRSL